MPISSLYRMIGSRLSPAGPNARLTILIYHRVLPEIDAIFPNEITAERFDTQMSHLKRVFNVLPLSEAVARIKAGTLPTRAACITFDDGYADNVTLALPILQKYGLHATFFIATAYLNGGRMFNDTIIEAVRRSLLRTLSLDELGLGNFDIADNKSKACAISRVLPQVKYLPLDVREQTVARIAELAQSGPLPNDLMMTTEQLKALHAAGMEIGGHTSRHPILAKLDDSAVCTEIAEGKDFLETTLGEEISLFAYPNGKPDSDYLPGQSAILRKLKFDAAVSTQRGSASRLSDLFQLPRFTPWQPNASHFIPALLDNLRHGA